jgi:hypothetical protein
MKTLARILAAVSLAGALAATSAPAVADGGGPAQPSNHWCC